MEKKVFRSRISVLLTGIVLAAFIFALTQTFQQMRYEKFFIGVGIFVFCVFIFSGIRYVITDEKLLFKIWWIPNGSCSISQIIYIKRSYNPLSSPAASLKRLRVGIKKGYRWPSYYLISPVREQEFLETLQRINSEIYICVSDKKGWWHFWDWDF